MTDKGRIRKQLSCRTRKSAHGLPADDMLHVEGLTRPKQRPIEDGMGDDGPWILCILQIELPEFDPIIPGGMDKAHVATGPGRDKQPPSQ